MIAYLIAAAAVTVIGYQVDSTEVTVVGTIAVALGLLVAWARRPRGRWACWNGHINHTGTTRCRVLSCDARK